MQRPLLLQVNARRLVRRLGPGNATLADVPEALVADWAHAGYNLLWLMGVWSNGEACRSTSLENQNWRREYDEALPDWTEADVCGSCFAICGYTVPEGLGGPAALATLRQKLQKYGVRLMLDFVPNHTALDHPWVTEHPERYVQGTADDLTREPGNYVSLQGRVFAYGRDPYFPGWIDTLQLNYAEPSTAASMAAELAQIARQCDGVRCDMAMLLLPDVFQSTWGRAIAPFWPEALAAAQKQNPGFLFLAEAYWDREWTLQQQGFDATYDKRLYDRVRTADAPGVRAHLQAGLDFQNRCMRFLENHDEPRAASIMVPGHHQAAAVLTCTLPGWRFLQEGQTTGARQRVPVQLCRAPEEPVDEELRQFYERLLPALALPALDQGQWQLLECREAWPGNPSHQALLCSAWQHGSERVMTVVNLAPYASQGYVTWPFPADGANQIALRDQLSEAYYVRAADDLRAHGLYLDLPAWGHHLFTVSPA